MADMNKSVLMELYQIVINENQPEQFVIIQEKDGPRKLPIMIGIFEANAINMAVLGHPPLRPLTHDLLVDCIQSLNAKLEKIVIDRLVKQTFHAKLHLNKGNDQTILVDARPSDAIAIAMRVGCDIEVAEKVLQSSGMQLP